MSSTKIAILGAIAGGTIFFGLPMGRVRRARRELMAFLNATAIGILVFLLYDVLSHAAEPVESALVAASREHTGSWWRFAGLAAVMVAGIAIGLLSLVVMDGRMSRPTRSVGAAAAPLATRPVDARPGLIGSLDAAHRLSLFIAFGIGLHNFSEGLAIGQSAAKGEVSLALMLIIGFGLHNATEGFGIVAPLAGEATPPSWGFLATMGVIGGGPTLVGTLVGRSFVNDTMYLAFLALAAGSILYVVVQLLKVAQRFDRSQILMTGLLAGLVAGFATDFVLVAAGA